MKYVLVYSKYNAHGCRKCKKGDNIVSKKVTPDGYSDIVLRLSDVQLKSYLIDNLFERKDTCVCSFGPWKCYCFDLCKNINLVQSYTCFATRIIRKFWIWMRCKYWKFKFFLCFWSAVFSFALMVHACDEKCLVVPCKRMCMLWIIACDWFVLIVLFLQWR